MHTQLFWGSTRNLGEAMAKKFTSIILIPLLVILLEKNYVNIHVCIVLKHFLRVTFIILMWHLKGKKNKYICSTSTLINQLTNIFCDCIMYFFFNINPEQWINQEILIIYFEFPARIRVAIELFDITPFIPVCFI